MRNNPDCGQDNAMLWLSAGVGGVIGLAYVAVAWVFWPYHVLKKRTRG